jgi:hypothetical protein
MIDGGPATTNQVSDGWKELQQKCLQIENVIKKTVNYATSLKSVAPDFHAFQKSCIHTPYIMDMSPTQRLREKSVVGEVSGRGDRGQEVEGRERRGKRLYLWVGGFGPLL